MTSWNPRSHVHTGNPLPVPTSGTDLGVGTAVDPALGPERGAETAEIGKVAVVTEGVPARRVVERLGVLERQRRVEERGVHAGLFQRQHRRRLHRQLEVRFRGAGNTRQALR